MGGNTKLKFISTQKHNKRLQIKSQKQLAIFIYNLLLDMYKKISAEIGVN